jgi:uncharacterized protein (TIGR02217 family)
MSDLVFPILPGISWNVVRTPTWATRVQTSISGKQTRQADWTYPRYSWELDYDFLRSAPGYSELQTLVGFINQMQGGFGTFLYSDDDDNSVTGQQIGTGDGTTTVFPLIRTYGGFIEPVGRANAVSMVTVGGTSESFTVTNDAGVESGSTVTLASAPAAGAVVAASFSYYWRCRFSEDTTDFTKFLYGLSSVSKLKFESVK